MYDKERNLSAVLRLFEKAVDSKQADTDIYTDTMASCFASRSFEVRQQLRNFAELQPHVCKMLTVMVCVCHKCLQCGGSNPVRVTMSAIC